MSSTTAVASREAMSADERTYRDLALAHTAQADLHEEWANQDRAELNDLDGLEGREYDERRDELVDNILGHTQAEQEFRGQARAATEMADRAAARERPQ